MHFPVDWFCHGVTAPHALFMLCTMNVLCILWCAVLCVLQDERMRLGEQLAGVREELRKAEQSMRARQETQSQVGVDGIAQQAV